jgi:hypothetical protein
MRRFGILILVLALIGFACNRGDDTELTTTTEGEAQTTTTTTVAGSTTDDGTEEETTTTVGTVEVPDYEIIAGDSGSAEYVVLVEPGAYTEGDIRNIMEDVVDELAPAAAHLVDTEEAGALVLQDEVTAAEQELLDAHYFARIVDGTTLEYVGPYSDVESVYIGS